MVINNQIYISHPKYDVRTANGVNGCVGYWVKLYLIFSDEHTYTLFNNNDWIEHINLIRENGFSCTGFTRDLLVTPTSHTSIYDDIHRYVSETNLH